MKVWKLAVAFICLPKAYSDEDHRHLKVRPVRFYAMGDAPYSNTEKENFPLQIANLDPSADFAVHLGDMQDRYVHALLARSQEIKFLIVTFVIQDTSVSPWPIRRAC